MRRVVIGRARSGAGKTALACRLLPRLPGWGALKVSPVVPGGHGLAGDYDIRIDSTILQRPGSARWVVVTGPASVLPAGLASWRERLEGDRPARLRGEA